MDHIGRTPHRVVLRLLVEFGDSYQSSSQDPKIFFRRRFLLGGNLGKSHKLSYPEKSSWLVLVVGAFFFFSPDLLRHSSFS